MLVLINKSVYYAGRTIRFFFSEITPEDGGEKRSTREIGLYKFSSDLSFHEGTTCFMNWSRFHYTNLRHRYKKSVYIYKKMNISPIRLASVARVTPEKLQNQYSGRLILQQ